MFVSIGHFWDLFSVWQYLDSRVSEIAAIVFVVANEKYCYRFFWWYAKFLMFILHNYSIHQEYEDIN